MSVTFGGYACIDPGSIRDQCEEQGLPTNWFGKPNKFMSTVGPDAGRGWVLMGREDIDKLDKDAVQALEFDDGNGGKVTVAALVFVRAKCVTPGKTGDQNACFLVDVRDTRHLFQNEFFSTPINKQYNVRAPSGAPNVGTDSYYADSLNAGALWTWQTMVDDIWTDANSGIIPDGSPVLPFTPHGTPEGFRFVMVPAWDAYNEVLHRIGCAATVDVATGGYSIVQIGASDASLTTEETAQDGSRLLDDDVIESNLGKIPEKVKVVFHRFFKHFGSEQTGITTSSQWSTNPVYVNTVTDPTGTTGVRVGSVATIYDDMPAIIDYSGAIVSGAALDARAAERAADYYRMLKTGGGIKQRSYIGIMKNFAPGSRLTGVCYKDVGGGFITEIAHYPPGLRPGDDGQWICSNFMVTERLQTPDLGRATFPNYPVHGQIVKVTNTTGTVGVHDGVVQRTNPATLAFSDGETCWVMAANLAVLSTGTYVYARIEGVRQETSSGGGGAQTRPLYALGNPAGLTVAGVDPGTGDVASSISGVSEMDFNLSNGFYVFNVGGGIVEIQLQSASGTHAGTVALGIQDMGTGAKRFDRVEFKDPADTATHNNAITVSSNVLTIGTNSGTSFTIDSTTVKSSNKVSAITVFAAGNGGAPIDGITTVVTVSAPVGTKTFTFTGGILTGLA